MSLLREGYYGKLITSVFRLCMVLDTINRDFLRGGGDGNFPGGGLGTLAKSTQGNCILGVRREERVLEVQTQTRSSPPPPEIQKVPKSAAATVCQIPRCRIPTPIYPPTIIKQFKCSD
jgi:hypothetical protein